MIGVLLAGGLPWIVVAVFAGAAAVGLVTWAFGDKIEEENEKWAARPSPEAFNAGASLDD